MLIVHRIHFFLLHPQLIDHGCCNPSAPLVLRSLNSEKRGYLASSLEDAKRALKLKESKKLSLILATLYALRLLINDFLTDFH